MRVSLSTYGSRGDAEPLTGPAPERAARIVADQFGVIAPAAEGCDGVTGVPPAAAGALSVAAGLLGDGITRDRQPVPA